MLRRRRDAATPRSQRSTEARPTAPTREAGFASLLWLALHAWHLLWTTLWQFGSVALAVAVTVAVMAGGTRLDGLKSGGELVNSETQEATDEGATGGGTHTERLQVAMSTSRLALLLWLEVLYPIVNHAVVQAQGLLAQYAPGIQETATAVGRGVWKQGVHAGKVGWKLGIARVRRASMAELATGSAAVVLMAMLVHAWRGRYASRTKEAIRRAIRSIRDAVFGVYTRFLRRWWLRARATTRALYSSGKHVGYVVGCAWSLWMFPTAISFVARSSWMRATLMTLLPAVGSLRALANHTYLPQDEWLVFWCMRAAYLLLLEVPLVSATISRLPHSSELALCLELWMLLARRSSEVRRALFGVFGHALGWKRTASTRGSHRASAESAMAHRVGAAISAMLSMLRTTGLVPARLVESAHTLKERFFKERLAALSLVFFFTPGFVTHYGCVLVGMLHPTHLSLTALHERQPVLIQRMLSSWVAYVAVMAAFRALVSGVLLGWMPFRCHVELMLTLGLILCGADQIVNFTLRLGRELSAARARVNQEIHVASERRSPLKATRQASEHAATKAE